MAIELRLLEAICDDDIEDFKDILEEISDVNFEYEGYTPLHFAVNNGNADMVKLLLEKGANIECQDNNGYTPLHIAVSRNNSDMVKLLLNNGANVNGVSITGDTPLLLSTAIIEQDAAFKIITTLIKYGADTQAVNAVNKRFDIDRRMIFSNQQKDILRNTKVDKKLVKHNLIAPRENKAVRNINIIDNAGLCVKKGIELNEHTIPEAGHLCGKYLVRIREDVKQALKADFPTAEEINRKRKTPITLSEISAESVAKCIKINRGKKRNPFTISEVSTESVAKRTRIE